jgi:23S rRNA pseudouridine1911/1915/1917 synthase
MEPAHPLPGFVEVEFTVEPNYDGWRLDRYLTQKLRRFSRARVQELIATSLASERPLKPASRVFAGLSFRLRRQQLEEPETPRTVPLLFMDELILVVDKPAGLPVHPTARYQHGTLVSRLRQLYGEKVGEPVHRLDRETSGLVVCARSVEASRYFMRAFQSGRVHKEYLAVCEGHPPEDAFEVEAPIALGGELVRIAVHIDPLGRPARTGFVVLKRFSRAGEPFALLRALPATGRQHQIRVHLRHAGYPIVGDKLYGPGECYYDRFCKHQLDEADWLRLRLPRHALHAHRLSFVHPSTKQSMRFATPLPADLREFILGR